MITANRRARATIAFFIPRRLAICIAQALSHDHFFECRHPNVSRRLRLCGAAKHSALRIVADHRQQKEQHHHAGDHRRRDRIECAIERKADQLARAGTASAAPRADEPEQSRRLGHTLERCVPRSSATNRPAMFATSP